MSTKYVYPNDFGMEPCKGLTKREYFAGLMMAQLVNSPLYGDYTNFDTSGEIWATLAYDAVAAADVLIEELEK